MAQRVVIGTVGASALERLTLSTALANAATARGYRVSSRWYSPLAELASEDERNATIEYDTGPRLYEHRSINFEADLKIAITQLAQLDAALLLVDARTGPTAAMQELAFLLRQVGVPTVIVALMNASAVDGELLDLVELEIREVLAKHGYEGELVPAVRLEAPDGESTAFLTSVAGLIDVFDAAIALAVDSSGPLLILVEQVDFVAGRGVVASGRIERGTARAGQQLELVGFRTPRRVTVQAIEQSGKALGEAAVGESVDLVLAGVDRGDVERGQVLAAPGSILAHTTFTAQVQLTPGADEKELRLWTGEPCEISFFAAQNVAGSIELAEGMLTAGGGGPAGVTVGVWMDAPIAVEPRARFAIRREGRDIGRGTVSAMPPFDLRRGPTTREDRRLALSAVPGWRVLRRVAARARTDVFVVGDLVRRTLSRIGDPLRPPSFDPADAVPFAAPVQLAVADSPRVTSAVRAAIERDVPFAELFEWQVADADFNRARIVPLPAARLGLPLMAGHRVADPAGAEADVVSGVYHFTATDPRVGTPVQRLLTTLEFALAVLDAPRLTRLAALQEEDEQRVGEFVSGVEEDAALAELAGWSAGPQRLHRAVVRCWAHTRSTSELAETFERLRILDVIRRVFARVELPFPADDRVSVVSTPTMSERSRLPCDTGRWLSAVEAEAAVAAHLGDSGQRLGGGQRVVWTSPELRIAPGERAYEPAQIDFGEFVHVAFAAERGDGAQDVAEDAGLAVILLTTVRMPDGSERRRAHPIPSTVTRRLRQLEGGRQGWTWTARCNCLGWLALSTSARFTIVADMPVVAGGEPGSIHG